MKCCRGKNTTVESCAMYRAVNVNPSVIKLVNPWKYENLNVFTFAYQMISSAEFDAFTSLSISSGERWFPLLLLSVVAQLTLVLPRLEFNTDEDEDGTVDEWSAVASSGLEVACWALLKTLFSSLLVPCWKGLRADMGQNLSLSAKSSTWGLCVNSSGSVSSKELSFDAVQFICFCFWILLVCICDCRYADCALTLFCICPGPCSFVCGLCGLLREVDGGRFFPGVFGRSTPGISLFFARFLSWYNVSWLYT